MTTITTLADLHAGKDEQYNNHCFDRMPLIPVRMTDATNLWDQMDNVTEADVPGLGAWLDEAFEGDEEFGEYLEVLTPIFVVPSRREDISDMALVDADCVDWWCFYLVRNDVEGNPVLGWNYDRGFVRVAKTLDEFLDKLRPFELEMLNQ